GTIEVTVEVDETHILSIDAVGENETPNVGQKALEKLSQRIIDANDTDIEGISGATYSSQGLFEAVNDALAQAYTGES
ncbi:MAG: FMN-binding protein, partial [Lachnospiraceae bacterium]|nr:FMN-binding protein [Lachnospiraceae bacterium]